MMDLYDRIVDPDLTIRRVNVVAVNMIKEDEIPEEAPEQLNLFVDYEDVERRREAERQHDAKERKITNPISVRHILCWPSRLFSMHSLLSLFVWGFSSTRGTVATMTCFQSQS